ncbi:MAG: helix-turn-helix domain-containing protein [Clostridiales bacterium]|nr:helix-turn-helix domain-containing protein [Clostridiales bacterium]
MKDRITEYGAFTLSSAAVYACVSEPTMLEWVNRRDFPAFRSGRRWIIPRASFDAWLDERAHERAQL